MMQNFRTRLGLSLKSVIFLVGLCAATVLSPRAETNPKFYAVMVSAQVQTSPAQITLRWSADERATGYAIARRNGSNWSTLANVSGSATSWTDSNVAVGVPYEYRVVKTTSIGYKGTGYLYAGINAPLKDSRGKVILLVDNTHAAGLSAELRRLEWDLAGDGWVVLRRDVSPADSVPNIKNIIKGLYASDPTATKAVFLFGHIPVPYSGNFTPDGHPDHQGAWPADLYYGDMDGTWTDSSAYSSGATKPANQNRPGDGKFDQSDMPSDVELAVGRVDFYNMTCYANKSPSRSERDLLRNYLNKDHNFRHRVFTVERRGVICDNFGERDGEAFASSGWRNFGSFFGAENVSAVGGWQYFSTVSSQGYLWSYGTGGGSWYTCDGVGSSDNFATTEIKTVFTMFLGSYFGDWDNESNFLRAALGSGYCLTTSWAGRPHWFYHHMGLGEPIGYSTILSQNNKYGGLYEGQNWGTRQVHAALLGDPTLRMHPVIPPSNLKGTASGSTMTLTWNASSDTDLQGYHVYRGTGPSGSFARLTTSPINSTTFTDSAYTSGVTYMVRAVKLERSGGGTYFNASQGIFHPATGNDGGEIPQGPAAPSSLTATAASASQVNLVWRDNASNETGFRIERKTGVSGTWSQVATVGANSTAYSSTGLSPSTTYFFRVFAIHATGTSAQSNEASATTLAASKTPAAVTFVGSDTTSQGSWKGNYGADGYHIITSASAYPGYVTVNASGKADYQWSDSSTDPRALQKVSGTTRVAGVWYSTAAFTVDLNFVDGNSHQFSVYLLDWDRSGRSQKLEILDASSGAILDTRTASNFGNGLYLSWNVKGAVRLRVTPLSGPNAVVNGLFFDPSTGGEGTASTKATGVVGGKFQLQITGTAGQKFDIYSTENLSAWTRIATVTLTGSTYEFVDTTSSGKTLRFYRAVAIP